MPFNPFGAVGPQQTSFGLNLADIQIRNAQQQSLARLAQIENFQQRMMDKYMQRKELKEMKSARRQSMWMNIANMILRTGTSLGGAAIMSSALKKSGGS